MIGGRLLQGPRARGVRRWLLHLKARQLETRAAFAAAWRRSMQLRVVISTLALSASVVVVLGLVLETQIADRLVQGKQTAAVNQAKAAKVVLERALAGVDPDRDGAQGTLNNALDRLTNAGGPDGSAPKAGEFNAVLATGPGPVEVSSGPLADVPSQLRATVADGALAIVYTTVHNPTPADGEASDVATLVIGQPVRTAGRNLHFYLLFPLSA
ncbi:MAG: histidine kinase, partial [Pseudonocardia sp.]|nr:histidine kinase [Pseudonocardia sp.]